MEAKKDDLAPAFDEDPNAPTTQDPAEEEKKATLLKVKKARVQYSYYGL